MRSNLPGAWLPSPSGDMVRILPVHTPVHIHSSSTPLTKQSLSSNPIKTGIVLAQRISSTCSHPDERVGRPTLPPDDLGVEVFGDGLPVLGERSHSSRSSAGAKSSMDILRFRVCGLRRGVTRGVKSTELRRRLCEAAAAACVSVDAPRGRTTARCRSSRKIAHAHLHTGTITL